MFKETRIVRSTSRCQFEFAPAGGQGARPTALQNLCQAIPDPPKSDLVSRKYLSQGRPVTFRRIPLDRIPPAVHRFLRRHWQRALRIRDKLRLSEETFHLLLAGGVGVLGGLVNLIFYFSIESVQRFIFHHEGDMVEVAETLAWWVGKPEGEYSVEAIAGILHRLLSTSIIAPD